MSLLNHWRHLLLTLVALGAVAAFAAACGGDDDEKKATASPAAGSPTAAEKLAADQTLRVRLIGEPKTLDPQIVSFATDLAVVKQLWRGLFYYDESLNVVAAAAKKVPTEGDGISADGLTYTIELRDDLTWSDGTKLTAGDFEYALKRLFDPEVGATGYYYSVYVDSDVNATAGIAGSDAYAAGTGTAEGVGVKALDDTHLEIKLTAPRPTLLPLLALWAAYPVRKDVIDANKEAWIEAGTLVGNGPFILKEWAHGDQITLEANPNYWGDDKPTLKTIVYKIIPDESVALISYQNDELDMTPIPLPEAKNYEGDAEQLKYAEQTIFAMEFNNKRPPFDNPNVRKAFGAAIDRDGYIQAVRGGVGNAALAWLAPDIPGFDPNRGKDYALNPTKAKQFLTDAGYPNGQGLPKVTLTVADSQGNRLSVQFLQQQIKQNLGIDVDTEVLESATYENRYNDHDFQVVFGGWGSDYADPENWLPTNFATGSGLNSFDYSNSSVDALFKQAAGELDNDKRIKLYQDAEKIIIDEDLGVAPIFNRTRNWLKKPYVDNLVTTGLDSDLPGDFFLDRARILEH